MVFWRFKHFSVFCTPNVDQLSAVLQSIEEVPSKPALLFSPAYLVEKCNGKAKWFVGMYTW